MTDGRLTLLSSTGEKFTCDGRIKDLSELIRHIVEDSGPQEEIPLVSVPTPVLAKVIEYCEHHSYTVPRPVTRPVPSDRMEDAVEDPWDAEFVKNCGEDFLVDLTLASNYMDMRCLLDLCCGKIATLFKGKTIDELRLKYGIKEEFTMEEEEQLKKDFPWALEGSEEQLLDPRS